MNKATLTRKEAADFLRSKNNFLLITHERPDPDALGSTLALQRFLNENNRCAEVLFPEPLPPKFVNLTDGGIIEQITAENIIRYDGVIFLDTPNFARAAVGAANIEELIQQSKIPVLTIDHHIDNDFFGGNTLLDAEAAATAQIVWEIINIDSAQTISAQTATLALIGLVGDTGGFRFDNTTAATLNIAAQMLSFGANLGWVNNLLFFSKPLNQQRFESEVVSRNLKLAFDNRFAYVFVPDELLKKYNLSSSNTDGVIDIIRSIDTALVVAVIYPKNNGMKVSLRSKDRKYSVGAIARALHGGGHELAAGGMIEHCDEKTAEQILLQHIQGLFS